ncbi:MAG: hypothetical protein ACRC2Y_04340 [Aeromonas veronii]
MLKSSSFIGKESLKEIMTRFESHDMSETNLPEDIAAYAGHSEEVDQILGFYIKAAVPLNVIGLAHASCKYTEEPNIGDALLRLSYQAFGSVEKVKNKEISLEDAVTFLRGFIHGGLVALYVDLCELVAGSEHEEMFVQLWNEYALSKEHPFRK